MTRKILTGALAVLLSAASGASAATISGQGSLFVAFNAGEAQNVDYVTGGARTNKPNGQYLTAPVIRNTITAGSQTFGLTGWHNGVQTSSCTLYSALADSTLVASKDLSANGVAGIWSRSASMTTAELSGAKVSVLCAIPASFLGQVSGVTATP